MGYGHVRAATPLARELGTEVLLADAPGLADAAERKLWARARWLYEGISRLSQAPFIGAPFRGLLDGVTAIPHLHPLRDLSRADAGVKYLHRLCEGGLGQGLARALKEAKAPLLTTFYAPAIAAEHHGAEEISCVVTDADISRIWAPKSPGKTRIRYLVPTARAMRRLRSYGVPAERIELTGFPLPEELLGGTELSTLRGHLGQRLVRLDPEGAFRSLYREELERFLGPLPKAEERRPPLLTLAVGGAGAQVELVEGLLAALRPLVSQGRVRVALVAGIRWEVAQAFQAHLAKLGLEVDGERVRLLSEPDMPRYLAAFNALMAQTDVLFTKPSELTFYGALGIPLVFSPPIGRHEKYNRRWARESGAGLKQRKAHHAAGWLLEWLADGTLAGAAWAGYMRLPKLGTRRILERYRG
jgi:hypothetical protein